MHIALVTLLISWADWVGDFHGTLTWKQCTAPGEKTVTLAVDAIDGAMRIDLAPAGAALRAMSLVQEDTAWAAQDGDLRVNVSHKGSAIELAIEYDSGCTARGKLVRPTTGVPACDRLLGWSRIEARCTKASTRLEDFPVLAKAKWKKTDAAKCAARADKVELAMIDAGCAPHPDLQIGWRALECSKAVDLAGRLARCGRVQREITTRITNAASALRAASETATRAELPYVVQQCKDLRAKIVSVAVQFQCH